MIVLGIDCTTKWTNIGISDNDTVLGEINEELGRKQASQLPLMVEKLTETCSLTLSDVDVIAAASGPGYYTGIRTGIAYASSLALALGLKIIPLATTELFVYDLRKTEKILVPVIKARSDSFYTAIYESDSSSLIPIMPPTFISSAQFAEKIKLYPSAAIVGSDVNLYPNIKNLDGKRIERSCGSGGDAALLGYSKRDDAAEPYKIKGQYLREPDIGPTKQ